ncbi:MAG: hypothetical protein M1832_003784 [Thelocarpon impressellum]|nr:MAG: hypothetical protein M1832_003784 [Thelocarpon impressellum]
MATLFCLGIILLELEFEETIENLLQGLQLSEDAAVGNSMLWDRIEDLKGDAGASLGDAYGRIVRQCLDCDFGTGSPDLSLDDRALRRKYYLDVIERLRTMITLDRRMEDLDRALPEMRI